MIGVSRGQAWVWLKVHRNTPFCDYSSSQEKNNNYDYQSDHQQSSALQKDSNHKSDHQQSPTTQHQELWVPSEGVSRTEAAGWLVTASAASE